MLLVQGSHFKNHRSREVKEFKSGKQTNVMLKYCIKIKELEAAWNARYKSLAGCSAIAESV